MGVSGKWLRSLITQKKVQISDQDKANDSNSKKKWWLWRSPSEGLGASSKRGHVSNLDASVSDDAFNAAVATVVRAPPKDFKMVRQEWAAIRIQTAFRGLLARQALRALKAVVRLQAIFRGRQVRKQAAVTLRCMQALVRVQAHVWAKTVKVSSKEQAADQVNPTKLAEQGWCNIPGTADEVRAKLKLRKEGAIKRERANAYSLSQQQTRSCPSPNSRANKPALSLKHHRLDKNSQEWSWLDSWMAAKPWENRLMEEVHTDPSEMMTPFSRKCEDNIARFYSSSSEHYPVKGRRINATAKTYTEHQITHSSFSPSSESLYDKTSPSSSSSSVSLTPVSGNILMVEGSDDSYYQKPSYMSHTESTKAKNKATGFSSYKNPLAFANGDTRSCADSNPSSNLCNDLYPPMPLDQHDWFKNQRRQGR